AVGKALSSAEIFTPPAVAHVTPSRLPNLAPLPGPIAAVTLTRVAPRQARATQAHVSPLTGKWTRTGSMHVARAGAPMVLLPSGRVLVEGCDVTGFVPGGVTAEIYDPATGTWSRTGSMHVSRCNHSAALLHDGRVLVAGGEGTSNHVESSVEIFDPNTGA